MRPKHHALRCCKRVGIIGGNTVARRIRPLHEIITRQRGHPRLHLRPVRIDAAARSDCTVLGRQIHPITV
ncbi:hypothetical protein Barb7_02511 [Bacteroidales bacterium Barb7]|nr:hypothetical protein Barb7_02511 [Bacteroidales bacterium Barb7]